MQFIWQEQNCPIFGHAFWLRGLREGESATAHQRGPHKYFAHAFVGGRYLAHTARTMRSAMTRLEREIDKRSIGLLDVDDVTFVSAP